MTHGGERRIDPLQRSLKTIIQILGQVSWCLCARFCLTSISPLFFLTFVLFAKGVESTKERILLQDDGTNLKRESVKKTK